MSTAGDQSVIDRERQRYERAQTKVRAIKGFYIHTVAFVAVNLALFAVNAGVAGMWWFYWPLLGWGIGLGVHAIAVYGFVGSGPWGHEWEERRIQALMDKDRER